ncbi:hypothetical protein DXG03_002156 [Asterophora parasitica]|uniref:[histone H3]-trimethyl-L-lysine(9) demethylase n=1 Tax=Asterophora parasitica TaxID=117018 RepID=A0A9P7GG84_9AGAR|nr:hypothetical protein DXG03_002156 [Asterophora parasitica]
MSSSHSPSLTPSRSPSPAPPVQPDHFYGSEDIQLPPSPNSDGKTWLDPEDDPLAHRGIPVFKPTMQDFEDFEAYVTKLECWGSKSGIVKIIPPKEWTEALPDLKEQLANVKIQTPIEQHMLGRGGLFRQENMEKRKLMSVREWAELCAKDEFRAPAVTEVGLHARSANVKPRTRKTRKKEIIKAESAGPDLGVVKEEPVDRDAAVLSPPNSVGNPLSPETDDALESKPKAKKRIAATKEAREAALAGRAVKDRDFVEAFNPHQDWLPHDTKASDYTREFCQMLERQYWRNLGLGKPAWYGADSQGSLYTDETKAWNVAHLPSALTRLLPADDQGLPGVNTPYLYFGMWRATFAWHVEDMDLFSINYIHFGAPKFWYAIPQGRAGALEQTMRGYFPKDTTNCPQFLRHKSFLASPTILAQSSCRPNFLVHHAGEFVITFPRGYHAGFNLGFNCAESVNFALESWIELGRRAKACECIPDSVRIDVDQLLRDREEDSVNPPEPPKAKHPVFKKDNDAKAKATRKRKAVKLEEEEPPAKKFKIRLSPTKVAAPAPAAAPKAPLPKLSITLKLGPRPAAPEPFPCCLCVSMDRAGLLRVYDPPVGRKDAEEAAGNPKEWLAHEQCASIIPETWVDEIELGPGRVKEKVVYGVDGIVKDRWHLKCSACTKNRLKAHGAPIQCTKGKCSKAFHVSCARDGAASNILFSAEREVEKEVVLLEPTAPPSAALGMPPHPDAIHVDPSVSPTDVNGMMADSIQSSRVLKVIKKLEVQVLCAQHNPVVAAAKKEAKQDKIRLELIALPPMTRIKIRVSSGVFEVSLIRVIEETKSVEVLWDKGDKREFKWNSVIFGNTEAPVQQKPSEVAPKTEREFLVSLEADHVTFISMSAGTTGLPVPTYSSVRAAAASRTPQATKYQSMTDSSKTRTQLYGAPSTQYAHAHPLGAYDYWQQHYQYTAVDPSNPYRYPGYYPPAPHDHPTATSSSQYAGSSSPYLAYAYVQNQYPGPQYHWQPPYQGHHVPHLRPQTSVQHASSSPQPFTGASTPSHSPQDPPPSAAAVHLPPDVQDGLYKGITLSSSQSAPFSEMPRDNSNNSHLCDTDMAGLGEENAKSKLLKTGATYGLGRKDCPLIISNKKVSSHHCDFEVKQFSGEDASDPTRRPMLEFVNMKDKGMRIARAGEQILVNPRETHELQDGDCLQIVHIPNPHVTHHIVPSYTAQPLVAASLLSACHFAKLEWLTEVIRLGTLPKVAQGISLESSFDLPPLNNYRPTFSPSLPTSQKEFRVWEPNEERLMMFSTLRFLYVDEKARIGDYKEVIERGGGSFETFDIAGGQSKFHRALARGQAKEGKKQVVVGKEKSISAAVGKEAWRELVEEAKSFGLHIIDPEIIVQAVIELDMTLLDTPPSQEMEVDEGEGSTSLPDFIPNTHSEEPSIVPPEPEQRTAPIRRLIRRAASRQASQEPTSVPTLTTQKTPEAEELPEVPPPRKALTRRVKPGGVPLVIGLDDPSVVLNAVPDLSVSAPPSPPPLAIVDLTAPTPLRPNRLKRRVGTGAPDSMGSQVMGFSFGLDEPTEEPPLKKFKALFDASHPDNVQSGAFDGSAFDESGLPTTYGSSSQTQSQSQTQSKAGRSGRTASAANLSTLREGEEETQNSPQVARGTKRSLADVQEDIAMDDASGDAVSGSVTKKRAVASNAVENVLSTSKPLGAHALLKPPSTAAPKAKSKASGALPGKPDQDAKFLKAIASTKRGKKNEDDFDRDFNKLKISKPELAHEEPEEEWAVLADFGDDSNKGDVVRKAKIELVLNEGNDYGMGAGYWKGGKSQMQTQGDFGATQSRSQANSEPTPAQTFGRSQALQVINDSDDSDAAPIRKRKAPARAASRASSRARSDVPSKRASTSTKASAKSQALFIQDSDDQDEMQVINRDNQSIAIGSDEDQTLRSTRPETQRTTRAASKKPAAILVDDDSDDGAVFKGFKGKTRRR